MRIWVDADACPVVIKEILFRVANRTQIVCTFVANQGLRVPPSPFILTIQVPKGFDVADNKIVQSLTAGDLIITADIPLAAQVIEKGAHALSPRGEFFSSANMAERLTLRNFMEELRGSGVDISGPNAFSHADRQLFAQQLDKFLANL